MSTATIGCDERAEDPMRLQVDVIAYDFWASYDGQQTMNFVVAVSEADTGAPVTGLTEPDMRVTAIAGEFDGVQNAWKGSAPPTGTIGTWPSGPFKIFEDPEEAPGVYNVHVFHYSNWPGVGIWAVQVERGSVDRGVGLASAHFREVPTWG